MMHDICGFTTTGAQWVLSLVDTGEAIPCTTVTPLSGRWACIGVLLMAGTVTTTNEGGTAGE